MSLTNDDLVVERSLLGLLTVVYSITDRATLHENNWMMPVFSDYCGRQTG